MNHFVSEWPSAAVTIVQGRDPHDAMENYLKLHKPGHASGFETTPAEDMTCDYFVRSCHEDGDFDYFNLIMED